MVITTSHVTSFENSISLSCQIVHLSSNFLNYKSKDIKDEQEVEHQKKSSRHPPLIYVFGGVNLIRKNGLKKLDQGIHSEIVTNKFGVLKESKFESPQKETQNHNEKKIQKKIGNEIKNKDKSTFNEQTNLFEKRKNMKVFEKLKDKLPTNYVDQLKKSAIPSPIRESRKLLHSAPEVGGRSKLVSLKEQSNDTSSYLQPLSPPLQGKASPISKNALTVSKLHSRSHTSSSPTRKRKFRNEINFNNRRQSDSVLNNMNNMNDMNFNINNLLESRLGRESPSILDLTDELIKTDDNRENENELGSFIIPQKSVTLENNSSQISYTPIFTNNLFVTNVYCGIESAWYKTANGEFYGAGLNRYGELGQLNEQGLCSLNQKGHKILSMSIGREHSICILEDKLCFVTGSNLEGQLGLKSCSGFSKEWKILDVTSNLPKKLLLDNNLSVSNVFAVWDSTFVCLESIKYSNEILENLTQSTEKRRNSKYSLKKKNNSRKSLTNIPISKLSIGENLSSLSKKENNQSNLNDQNNSQIEEDLFFEFLSSEKNLHHNETKIPENVTYLLLSCGSNRQGQLGISHQNFTSQLEIVAWPEKSKPIKIRGGANHIIILDHQGVVWGCGSSSDGQLGSILSDGGTAVNRFQTLNIQYKVVDFDCGDRHSVFLDVEGNLFVSGYNGYHACGIPGKRRIWTLTRVDLKEKISHIACGSDFTVIQYVTGHLFGCGRSSTGALGPTEEVVENIIDDEDEKSKVTHSINRKVFPTFRNIHFPFHSARTIHFSCGKDFLIVVKDSSYLLEQNKFS